MSGLRIYRPVTAGQRGLVLINRQHLFKGRPMKELCTGLQKTGGRVRGRLTAKHRGGGHKRLYRLIDFKRNLLNREGVVERIEYDPNRSAFIALVHYEAQGEALSEYRYILAPQKLAVGDRVVSSLDAPIRVGNALLLKNIPVGTLVHNIEMKKKKGGQLARSAGAYAQVVGHDVRLTLLRLPSGEMRKVSDECMATVGTVSNEDRKNQNLAKAGRSRWLGWRPHVRGVAMNPIDHPMGGGEGRTSGGRHPCSAKGKLAKGKKTRSPKKASSRFIVRKRSK